MSLKTPAAVIVLGAAVAVAAVAAQEPTDETRDLYKSKCQACHLADGKGSLPEMNFTDDKWIHGSTRAEITKVIAEGVPGKAMLGFKAQLTEAQIEALGRYVRAFDKTLKPEKPVKEKK